MAKAMKVPVLIFEDSDEAYLLIDAIDSFLSYENNLSDDEYESSGELSKHQTRVKMSDKLKKELNKIFINMNENEHSAFANASWLRHYLINEKNK